MGALIPLCFIVSGATSLVLQVVWVRKLVEVFGSSTLAIATVLASFMGGLALGAAIGGRLADRVAKFSDRRARDPLLYYGIAEAIVGLSALVIPLLITLFRGPNAWLWGHLSDTPALLALARFGLTALILLIPTTAMGATLPLLTRRVTSDSGTLRSLGSNLGILYAANTFGAVVGAAIAGFTLIPALGAHASGQLAALIAIALAAAVAVASFRPRRRPPLEEPSDDESPATPALADEPETKREASKPTTRETADARMTRRLALIAYAVSGAVAMALEVLFSRALAIVNGSSVTSFTLILVVFLAGISIGAALISRYADRTDEPLALLARLLLLAAAAIVVTIFLVDDLPKVSAALLEGGRFEPRSIMTVHAAITALAILPVAIALGATMPVAIRAYVGSEEHVGRDVGRAYAANTIGAIVGSVAAGFVLMPLLTIETTLRLLVVIDALMAAALYAHSARIRIWPRRRLIATTAAVAAVCLASVIAPSWDRSAFTAGLFRAHVAKAVISTGSFGRRDVLFYKDGSSSTVTVERLVGGVIAMKNNGKVDASSRVDMPTQILVGLLPVLLHGPEDKDVFVVGYGSGVTVGAIAAAPTAKRIVVAELESAVYEAADAHFSDINGRPQDDPRVERLTGDGRNVLLAGGRQYDVIVSEPSNPWIAGIASLFTREFYQFARRHLKPGGIFCQWAQLYELGPANVKMIYRTFAESFPYVYAFTPGDEVTDTVLIGSLTPVDLSPERLTRIIDAHPSVRDELDRALVERSEDLIAAAFLLPSEIASFTAGADINTDDNGALEYRAPRDLLDSAQRKSFARKVRSPGWPYGTLTEILPVTSADPALAKALLAYGRRRAGREFLDRAPPSKTRDSIARLYALTRIREVADPELGVTQGGPSLPTPSASLFAESVPSEKAESGVRDLAQAYSYIAAGEWAQAHKKLAALPKRADSDAGRDVALVLGYVAYKSIDFTTAQGHLAELARTDAHVARRPSILYYLGRSQYGMGSFRTGLKTLSEFATRFPTLATKAIVDPFDAPQPPTGDAKLEP